VLLHCVYQFRSHPHHPPPCSRTLHHRALRNGHSIELLGSVTGPSVSAGMLVVLQARPKGARHWRTFDVVSTGPGPNFSDVYTFTSTTDLQVYPLRAWLPPQSGFASTPIASPLVRVRVTG
jgi:hypothetical protein